MNRALPAGIVSTEESFLQSSHWRQFNGIIHAFSTRNGGRGADDSLSLGGSQGEDSGDIEQNRRLFCQRLGIDPSSLFIMKQVHGKEVVIVENTDQAGSVRKKLEADGAITQKKNLALTIQTADCVPVLLYDPIRQVIGAVHSGWRSAAQGIIAEALSKMKRHFRSNPADCHALIGPSIGACCYEVGEDVIRHFPVSVWNRMESERYRLDLCKTAYLQLSQSGIKEENILQVGLCTACHTDLFFSYRAEGPNTGRMMALVMMQ